MKVINIYGGPGTGKSTTAAGVFYNMKLQGYKVELVTEFAKDLVYGGQIELLLDQQEYIFAEQNYRLHRLRNHVDYVVTDSPITIGTVYMFEDWALGSLFEEFVFATYHTYDNINIMLERSTDYDPNGRRQDEAGAMEVDRAMMLKLHKHNVPYDTLQVNDKTVDNVIEVVRHFA